MGGMRSSAWVSAWLLLLAGCTSAETAPGSSLGAEPCTPSRAHALDDTLRLHHVQVKSTHNSYHVEPPGNRLQDWDYTMPPLDEQLDAHGVRHFELDIRFDEETQEIAVYHLPIVDEVSTCPTLVACLQVLREWSHTHRGHLPLLVHIEPKHTLPSDAEAHFDLLHRELTSVWPEECIVTPDEVRGAHATLAEAVAAEGFPLLGDVRGRVLFMLLDTGTWREAYTRGRSDIGGRLLFAEGDAGEPFAAVRREDGPIEGGAAIGAAVRAGMLVRTRADSGSVEPLAGDTTRAEAALASGAHMISTDYPAPGNDKDYTFDIPGGTPARCNPVTAPGSCTPEALEDPARLAD